MLIYRQDKERYKKEVKESKVFVPGKFFREKEKNTRFVYHSNFVGTTANGRWKVEVNSLEYFMRASTFEMALLT